MNQGEKGSWAGVKTALRALDQPALIALVHDLYDASPDNRRFLHGRLLGTSTELAKYRALVEEAAYPNVFGRKPVRLGEAQRLVRHFERATKDREGTVELMLTLVEAGTDLAAETGYGDEVYFRSLEKTLLEAVKRIKAMAQNQRAPWQERLDAIVSRAASIGWGYCDATREIVGSLERRARR